MPRPEVDKECLERINDVMENSEKTISSLAKTMTLEMLQRNDEVTDSITIASLAIAKTFADKFNIEPTAVNLRNLIGDTVFANGIAPLIKELIKADKEARND